MFSTNNFILKTLFILILDSTMSLNIISVTLNMDTVNFLGISIVGQSNKFGDGDCGIYVGSIMKGNMKCKPFYFLNYLQSVHVRYFVP